MTQHTHTPAPWEIVWPENKGVSPRIKSYLFGTICRTNDILPIENGYEENKANTRLIAAAPELLAALEWCLMVYGHEWPENASIRDTIKKAKGE